MGRDARANSGLSSSQASMTRAVWVRSRVVPNCFFNLQPPMTRVVRGDDFATEGPDEQQDELDALLMDNVRVKMLGRVGPGYSHHGTFPEALH